jgi:transcriptional regulator with XRE-family HTH domain
MTEEGHKTERRRDVRVIKKVTGPEKEGHGAFMPGLLACRLAAAVSQAELAKLARVAQTTIRGLESGDRRAHARTLRQKADALVSQGECGVPLLGMWDWKREGHPLPDWNQIPMIGREVRILFDSDAADKVEVRHALYALSRLVRGKVLDS